MSTGHFTMYRRGDLSATHNELQANAANEPQFEGYVFADGTCVLRWLTAVRSTSVWASFADAMAIHGHPEYDSELVWSSAQKCCAADGEYCDCAACEARFAEEAAHYRRAWAASHGDLADMRDAYDITDPKHPDFAETMLSRADAARKGEL